MAFKRGSWAVLIDSGNPTDYGRLVFIAGVSTDGNVYTIGYDGIYDRVVTADKLIMIDDFLKKFNQKPPSDAPKLSELEFDLESPLSSFYKVLDEMYHLYQKKNADYGDSFSTLFKAFGEAYAFGHIVEKVERLKSLYEKGKLENESVRDSLIDLANYTVMTIVELDKAESNECKNT